MRSIALCLLLPCLAFAAERFDLTTTETTPLAPGGTVRIEGSAGELNVEGWDQPNVEVRVTRYSWGDNELKAKGALGRIQVSKRLNRNVLTLSAIHKRFSDAHVDYRIRVPHNTNLVIHHGTGDVTIYDVEGNIDAGARFGDVVAQLPANGKYDIDAHTRLGSVYSDFAGVHHTPFSIGESVKPTAAATGPESTEKPRQIRLHTDVGGVTVQRVPAEPLLSLN